MVAAHTRTHTHPAAWQMTLYAVGLIFVNTRWKIKPHMGKSTAPDTHTRSPPWNSAQTSSAVSFPICFFLLLWDPGNDCQDGAVFTDHGEKGKHLQGQWKVRNTAFSLSGGQSWKWSNWSRLVRHCFSFDWFFGKLSMKTLTFSKMYFFFSFCHFYPQTDNKIDNEHRGLGLLHKCPT